MKPKTYTERNYELPFDWNNALSNPPEKSTPYHIHLHTLASDWVTCACGNQCNSLERHQSGEPTDPTLARLGMVFTKTIKLASWKRAKDVLKLIEERSIHLLKTKNV